MKLIVWQKAMQLFELVFRMVFTESKIDFKLRSQIADAAQSISANTSEGYGRRSISEYIQFLYYALGSLAEIMCRAIVIPSGAKRSRGIPWRTPQGTTAGSRDLPRNDGNDQDWISRIAEDPEEYVTPSLHHSITPSPQPYA